MATKQIEKQIEELDKISSWTQKVRTMKQIRDTIKQEQNKLDLLLENIINDKQDKKKVKLDKRSIDDLIMDFNNINNFEDKIKVFYMVKNCIQEMETNLFC
jgi:hypothetical protein